MKELIFADGRKVTIQSVTEAEGVMHVRMILITAEEIKALFGDEFATSRMVLTENYQEKEVYENYTDLKYIKEETGGIWEVEMRQAQADSDTRLDKLEEKSKEQEKTLEKQGKSIESQRREIEKHIQTLTEQETNLTEQGKEIEKIKEDMQQGGGNPEMQAAAMIVAQFSAQALPDALALEAKAIYPAWDGNGVKYAKDHKVLYKDVLYKCLTEHTSQADWAPDTAPSLWAKVLIPDPEVIPDWEQPLSTNGYKKGDRVKHKGKTWESLVDNNVWEPGVVGTEGQWKEVQQ